MDEDKEKNPATEQSTDTQEPEQQSGSSAETSPETVTESDNSLDSTAAEQNATTTDATTVVAEKTDVKKPKGSLITRVTSRLNIYLLAFILLIVVSLIIIFVVINSSNKQAAQEAAVKTQELTQDAVDNLTSNEATVGDPKQLLTIESNAVFSGKVLIRDGLDVAGPIKVGGELNLPGITVSGKSAFDEVKVNSLSIAGDTSVQGLLTVQNNLTVNGQGSFAGPLSAPSITIDAITLNGDLQFNRHIDAGGASPGISSGGAIGGGGTVTISGTDTAGTITINVGSGAIAGQLASITFANTFAGNPHVVITPVASLGAGPISGNTQFYLSSRTTSGFTIATSQALGSGSISFDYIVVD